ncbi:hypothetical protein OIU77_014879 [Salix suchowensis]|uniref:Late embryogenesis abundant protein LEA-2 subgroup domain-containing protein n=1 Tax=Salix suchowensis TaxID=1278906 RepID=A0ABQ8ZYT3_9ROSI|nr:hypothetical protein OIU77_014879 [Salix suchowensis]
MSSHPETNPHFIKAPLQKREGQPSRTPTSHGGVSPGRQEQQNQQPQGPPETRSRNRGQGSKKKGGASVVQPKHGGEFRSPWTTPAQQHPGQHPDSNFPPHESQVQNPPTQPPPKLQNKSSLPHFPLHGGDFQSPWAFQPQPRGQQYQPYDPKHDREPQVPPPGNQDQDRGPGMTHPQHQEQPRRATGHGVGQAHFSGLPKTWRNQTHNMVRRSFLRNSLDRDIPGRPNCACSLPGSLLNADLSVLANFTNPNKKVSVDFSYMVIDLYYGSTLIATQYIEPFSAERAESRFVNVHMVTSQVRLPVLESERLQEQISKNGAIFAVKGVFRVRSKLGTLLKYSYRLYGHCTIMVTAPPDGVLRATKCRTKR